MSKNNRYNTVHLGMDDTTRALLKGLASVHNCSMSKMIKKIVEWAYHYGHFGLTDKDRRKFTKLVKKHKEDFLL